MGNGEEKNIWFPRTLLFFLCLRSEQHVLFLHREVFFVARLALNIRIMFKTQKAEGFWQNSRSISHPSILIVLCFLSSCQGLGRGREERSAVGMDVQMAQRGAICQTERKRPGFSILYSLWLWCSGSVFWMAVIKMTLNLQCVTCEVQIYLSHTLCQICLNTTHWKG